MTTSKNSQSAIEAEQAAFDSQLDELMKEHAGQFALFHAGKPAGFFQTFEQAYRGGLERFGVDGVFLVSEVRKRGPEVSSISWLTGAMSGEA